MDVLVAGKGFIGAKLGERLEEQGHNVSYLDHTDGDYMLDITRRFSIDKEFDVVYHTIGLAPGFHDSKEYYNVHVEGTENIVDCIDAEKFVYISALGADHIDHSYFKSKREAEKIIKESGQDYTIVRPSTVAGEGNKLLDMVRQISFTRIFPNLPTEMQPVEVDEFVEVLLACLDNYNRETLEVAGDETITLGEMACNIYREEGYSCLLVPMPVFVTKLGLSGFRFLPPPFLTENRKLLEIKNTLDNEENDKERVLSSQD